MATDARVRYTKMVIQETIIQLIQEKPFHKITLTEVCKIAQINRATFYKHYIDIYDWKEQLENECIETTLDITEHNEYSNLEEILRLQFQCMKDNAKLYSSISSPNFESNVLDRCISLCLEKADEETKNKMFQSDDYQRRWNCYFVVRGCLGVNECWLKDGMREEPAVLADFCVKWMYQHFDEENI